MRRHTESITLKRCVTVALVLALGASPVMTAAAGSEASAGAAATAPSGALVVESEPAGAAVYVDGQLTGQTPLHLAGLTAGDHRVRLVKSGYLENARLVSVGSAARTVRVPLTRDAGSRPELAAQLGGGGGGDGDGGRSKLPLILALAGGGAVAAYFLLKKGGHAPTVDSLTVSPTTGIVGTTTTFAAVNAADQDGDALSFAWDFGDNTTGTGATTTHTYAVPCTCTVKLTVTAGSDSVSTTTSLVVKSLTGTWTGKPDAWCCTVTTTVVLTQTGTNLAGTFTDDIAENANVVGTVNTTTRQVNLTLTFISGGSQMTFSGTPNAAANTLTGTCASATTVCGAGSPWILSHP
jgi:hypothetical protein